MATNAELAHMAVTTFVWEKKAIAELEQEVKDRIEIYKEGLAELKSHLKETEELRDYIDRRRNHE